MTSSTFRVRHLPSPPSSSSSALPINYPHWSLSSVLICLPPLPRSSSACLGLGCFFIHLLLFFPSWARENYRLCDRSSVLVDLLGKKKQKTKSREPTLTEKRLSLSSPLPPTPTTTTPLRALPPPPPPSAQTLNTSPKLQPYEKKQKQTNGVRCFLLPNSRRSRNRGKNQLFQEDRGDRWTDRRSRGG